MGKVTQEGEVKVAENAIADIIEEFRTATAKFQPFHSAHEGYAVLAEEVDELWDEVKGHRSLENYDRMIKEAIQVGAMALRFLVDITIEEESRYGQNRT